jgi:hypothetical protein
MLDKPQYGEEEPREPLKCEDCAMEYTDRMNWKSIDDTGLCCDCVDKMF